MDTEDERDQSIVGGAGNSGDSSELNTESDDKTGTPPVFSISQEDFDAELIRHGSGFADGKFRIYRFYEANPTKEDAVKFLKNEYGIGGHSHTYLDGTRGFVDHDGKGLKFSVYSLNDEGKIKDRTEFLFKWPQVDTRLRFLIEAGRYLNQYFIDNPQMVLGTLITESTQYGRQETTVAPIEDEELSEQLRFALTNIHADIAIADEEPDIEEDEAETIPADPSVRNYSFTLFEGDVYFREDSVMRKVDAPATALSRIKGMIELRDSVRKVIGYQLEGWSDDVVRDEQKTLNALYDSFAKKYGLISSRANKNAFSGDSSYSLLSSLEILGEDGELIRKADIFSKRTIRQRQEKTHVDSATEALAVSLNERAKVDLPYMAQLTGKAEEKLEEELGGIVFRDFSSFNPAHIVSESYQRNRYPLVTADEFLSGNVRQKLRKANELFELLSKRNEETGSFDKDLEQIAAHIAALTKVQPQQLTASEIDVRLGATWLPTDIVQDFMYELLNPNYWVKRRMRVQYSPVTAQWNITEKNADFNNPAATLTYGTSRINAYKIIEETLNLKDVRIFDTIEDQDGREVRVLNKKEKGYAR